jgi:hypothetical protein
LFLILVQPLSHCILLCTTTTSRTKIVGISTAGLNVASGQLSVTGTGNQLALGNGVINVPAADCKKIKAREDKNKKLKSELKRIFMQKKQITFTAQDTFDNIQARISRHCDNITKSEIEDWHHQNGNRGIRGIT